MTFNYIIMLLHVLGHLDYHYYPYYLFEYILDQLLESEEHLLGLYDNINEVMTLSEVIYDN